MRQQLVGLAVLGLLVSGCGTTDDRDEVRSVTETFYAAVRADDGARACALMTEPAVEQLESQTGQSCDDVVTGLQYEGGEVVETEVYVTNGRAATSNGETAYLAREPQGWRLSALACVAQKGKPRDRPFDCEVEA